MKYLLLFLIGTFLTVSAAQASEKEEMGETIYKKACKSCHGTGIAGAPKTGDEQAWKDRIAQGMDTLVKHSIEGFKGQTGFMPAKGGRPSLTDAEVAAAVAYMVEESK